MKTNIPKKFLRSKYRKEMWQEAVKVIKIIGKSLPATEIYVVGSFASNKRRPADVDFIVLLETPKNKRKKWSFDMVVLPDNNYGKFVLKDAQDWVKHKYGVKNSAIIKLK